MKLYLLILLSMRGLFALSVEHILIEKKPFTLTTEKYNEYGTKGEVVRFYKGREQNQSSELLTFVLRESSGSCAAKELEEGSYEINASTVTFYTSWSRQGKAYDAPKGARIQLYEVLENSALKELSSKLYIETSRKNHDKESGMKYLFTSPKTEEKKASLKEYVDEVEEQYHGKFIFGEEAKKLMHEVKQALRRKRKAVWSGNR